MMKLAIPGFNDHIELRHLVLDFNGTLAIDGILIPGAKEALQAIAAAGELQVHVVTGDTYGTAHDELRDIPCHISGLPAERQNFEKEKYLLGLGPDSVISIGNGRNDYSMLRISAIGILVIQKEGAAAETLQVADAVCTSILDALDLLRYPQRLRSTLRS